MFSLQTRNYLHKTLPIKEPSIKTTAPVSTELLKPNISSTVIITFAKCNKVLLILRVGIKFLRVTTFRWISPFCFPFLYLICAHLEVKKLILITPSDAWVDDTGGDVKADPSCL